MSSQPKKSKSGKPKHTPGPVACLCGALPGLTPHDKYCPYPMYARSATALAAWLAAKAKGGAR